jgi:uncharacterized membrane protein
MSLIADASIGPDAVSLHTASSKPHRVSVAAMIAASAVVLFLASSLRHMLFRSGAFDLGFFDQAVWLISRGREPISSILGIHVLSDHASFILYPIALLYVLFPSPFTLLAIQAICLAGGAWPVWKISLEAGLGRNRSLAMVAAYLSYPLILTANIFDFHPEVIAVPALLMAILAARRDRRVAFCAWIAVALACKEVLSLTVAAMGLWLLLGPRKRFCGLVALLGGAAWFAIATQWLIPHFSGDRGPSGLGHYSYLGSSVGQIALSVFTRPGLIAHRVISLDSLTYLAILFVPVIWGIHRKKCWPLLAAAPAILLNLLSDNDAQRSPFFQYSLPALPFIFTAVIETVGAERAWLSELRGTLGWSAAMLAIGLLGRIGKMQSTQVLDWEMVHHTRTAVQRIRPGGRVLTTFETVPHLSHREVVEYVGGVVPMRALMEYDYILLSTRHSSLDERERELHRVLAAAMISPAFHLEYAGPDVFLFRRHAAGALFALARE